jgi:tripartite-type tricarboxylate transporter receptor subunit TctC
MLRILIALFAIALSCVNASAETYPSRPITIVVPFAAGGPADTLARFLAESMKRTLNQPVIIEDVPGAAGTLGVGRLVRARPDGYTIGIGHLGTNVFNGAVYNLPFDLLKDLEPISLLQSNDYMILTKPGVPANTIPELVAWLKANPDQATAGTAGIGTIGHLATLDFARRTGVSLRIVPYRGGAPAFADALAGNITLIFDLPTASTLAIASNAKMKQYAIMAPQRITAAPHVPSVDEVGLKGLYTAAWYGFWAPKGTPKDVIAKLNTAAREAMADPEFIKRMEQQSATIPTAEQQSPEWLADFQAEEIAKWWPLIKGADIKIQ